jgi:tRNA dimethylallyltransferase
MSNEKDRVLVITGPTASGKTNAAIEIAEYFKNNLQRTAEIISADSRQVYKHIPIATSQPTRETQKKFRHRFIGQLELEKEFSAGEYSKEARNVINDLLSKDRIPIVVGGSGLYVNALVYGLFKVNGIMNDEQKNLRKSLYLRLENEGVKSLLTELERVDAESAGKMTVHNERRIIRALEIYRLTGIPISQFHKESDKPDFKPAIFGIQWDRKKLYERINSRVDKMIDSGLIEEVKTLKENGYDYRKHNSLNTVGVKEVFDYLDEKTDYERMVELIKQNTRRFAKRQMTWFRKDKNIKWIEVNEDNGLHKAAAKIFSDLR